MLATIGNDKGRMGKGKGKAKIEGAIALIEPNMETGTGSCIMNL